MSSIRRSPRLFLTLATVLTIGLVGACSSSTPSPSASPSAAPLASPSPAPSAPSGAVGTAVPLSPSLTVYAPAPAPTSCGADRVANLADTMTSLAAFTINFNLARSGEPKTSGRFEWVGPTAARQQIIAEGSPTRGTFIIGAKVWYLDDTGAWIYSPNDGSQATDLFRGFLNSRVVATQGNVKAGAISGLTCQYDLLGDGTNLLALDGLGRLISLSGPDYKVSVDYQTAPSLTPPTAD